MTVLVNTIANIEVGEFNGNRHTKKSSVGTGADTKKVSQKEAAKMTGAII